MPRQRQTAEARRAQIADAALRILAADGVQGLTAVALGDAVGLRDASLFRHFPNKDAIVVAAVERFEAWLAGSLERTEVDPLQRLHAFFVHRLTVLRSRPEILRLAFNDRLAEAGGPEAVARVRGIVGRSRAFVRGCLHEGQSVNAVRADVPADVLAWTVMGVMRGAALVDSGDLEAAPEAVWASLEHLLAPLPASPGISGATPPMDGDGAGAAAGQDAPAARRGRKRPGDLP